MSDMLALVYVCEFYHMQSRDVCMKLTCVDMIVKNDCNLYVCLSREGGINGGFLIGSYPMVLSVTQ